MKGNRYTTEDKVRILREADRGGKKVKIICRENNISGMSLHRRKSQFWQRDVSAAVRPRELERESYGFKELLAALLNKPQDRHCIY